MWWEFKIILTVVLVLVSTAVWRERNPDDRRNDAILAKVQLVAVAIFLLVLLWFIWGPPHDGSEEFLKSLSNRPRLDKQPIEK